LPVLEGRGPNGYSGVGLNVWFGEAYEGCDWAKGESKRGL